MNKILQPFDRFEPGVRFGALVGVWVALLLAAVNIRVPINDNIPNVLLPVSLLTGGDFELGEFVGLRDREPPGEQYWAVQTPRGLYSKYPVWTGLISTPVFAPVVWALGNVQREDLWLRIGRLVALLYSGVCAGVLASMLRRYLPGRWALPVTFSVVLGTALWHHMGSHLTNQTVAIVCISIVVAAVANPDGTAKKAWLAGLLAGLALSARPAALFAASAPLGVFLTERTCRRHLSGVIAGAVVFPLLTLAYNATAFGAPFRTGYDYAVVPQRFSAPFLEGAAGVLFSPTCGLFLYSPFLLVILLSAIAYGVQRRTVRTAERAPASLLWWLMAGFAGQWLLFSKWYSWNGGLSYGCRMMAECVPLFAGMLALSWTTFARRVWLRRILITSGVIAVLMYLLGTVTYDVVAADNPLKSNWSWGRDFVALFVHKKSAATLLLSLLQAVGTLLALLVSGGYLMSRFLSPVQNWCPATDPAASRL